MNLICSKHERGDLRCEAIEKGEQCNHGVRNIKRMLCSMHYARWQRSGSIEKSLPSGCKESREARANLIRMQEAKRQYDGLSVTCLCAHPFSSHSRGGCREEFCKCFKFQSTNEFTFRQAIQRMRVIGFTRPLNDTAMCGHCKEYIRVGTWHDQMVLTRMREHLRVNHLYSRKLRAV